MHAAQRSYELLFTERWIIVVCVTKFKFRWPIRNKNHCSNKDLFDGSRVCIYAIFYCAQPKNVVSQTNSGCCTSSLRNSGLPFNDTFGAVMLYGWRVMYSCEGIAGFRIWWKSKSDMRFSTLFANRFQIWWQPECAWQVNFNIIC